VSAPAASFTEVELPPLSVLGPEPTLPAETYARRWELTRERMRRRGVDTFLVYADREHPGGISWLTGFDPRFEEALFVLPASGVPAIVAGNESLSMVADVPLEVRGVLCQSFSLPGQDRSVQRRLSVALREAGLTRRSTVGVVGWRPVPHEDSPGPLALAVPGFVVAEIAEVTLEITDASALLGGMWGLRADNDVDQLALYEHRSTRSSHHVWNAVEALAPGTTELELSAAMRLTGLPLSCHVMCASGEKTVNGLYSATDRVIGRGDRLSLAVGLWGGLTSRAGRVAAHGDDAAGAEFQEFVAGYWRGVATWYGELRLGASTAQVTRATVAALGDGGIRPLLNPGHLQQTDEWLDSPFTLDSTAAVRSGWSLQADIIPVGAHGELFTNMEDALAVADADLRAEFAARHPEAWQRITDRRRFMTETLGIELAEEVLPFCDRQGVLPSALLTPGIVPALR